MPEATDAGCDAGEFHAQADTLEEVIEAGNYSAPIITGVIADLISIFIKGNDCSKEERGLAVLVVYYLRAALKHGNREHKALRLACDALLEGGIAREADDARTD